MTSKPIAIPEEIVGYFVGALIGEEDRLYEIDPPIEPQDLEGHPAVQQVYETIWDLSRHGFPPTPAHIVDEARLRDRKAVTQELVESLAQSPHREGLGFQAHIIKEYVAQRRLFKAVQKQAEIVNKGVGLADTQFTQMQAELDAAMPRLAQDSVMTAEEMAEHWIEKRQERIARLKSGIPVLGFPPHWGKIAKDTRGFENGQITVISGKRGQGKSTLAMNVAWYVAKFALVAFFHLETSAYDLFQRWLISEGGYIHRQLDTGKDIDDVQGIDVERHAREIVREYGDNLYFIHCPGQSVHYLAAKIRYFKRQAELRGLQFLPIIDYMGKISTRHYSNNLSGWEKWYQVMLDLKDVAEINEVPILLLSQESESSTSGRKQTSFSTEIENQSQLWVSIDERPIAEDTLLVGPQRVENGTPYGFRTMHPGELSPSRPSYMIPGTRESMPWHRKGELDSKFILNIAKQNEGPQGKYPMRILNYRYLVFGLDDKGELIQPE